MSSLRSSAVLRRQKDQRRGIRFTMMVVGPSGTGKTTFINTLLDQDILPTKFNYSNLSEGQTIPETITYTNLGDSVLNAVELEHKFDPSIADQEPGIAITETSVEILDEDNSKLLLSVIDTPGFGDNLNNEICCDELVHFLEQQFDSVLAEETRVRRNPRFEDTRVHVCLYFITPTGHGLRELDVETMKKLSKYVNIIPVISKADSFTKNELINFKRNIKEDIERFSIPIYQFTFDDEEEDSISNDGINGQEEDLELLEENKFLNNLQPFAIITSNDKRTNADGSISRVRKYPWGEIDINDTEMTDFPVLKSVLFGSHLQDLKDITHDYLYEAYRTERLLGVSELQDLDEDTIGSSTKKSINGNGNGNGLKSAFGANQSQPPSMSNLADIANSKSMMNFGKSLTGSTDDVSSNFNKRQTDTESLHSKMSGLTMASSALPPRPQERPTSTGSAHSHAVKSMLIDESETIASKSRTNGAVSSLITPPETSNGHSRNGDSLIKTNPDLADDNYSFQNDEEFKDFQNQNSTTQKPPSVIVNNNFRSPQTPVGSPRPGYYSPSLTDSVQYSPVNKQQIRKISETIPYYLKHENIRSKQLKLQELEKKAALELSKRAADLEKKAMELKKKEKLLRLEISKRELSQSQTADEVSSVAESTVEGNDEN